MHNVNRQYRRQRGSVLYFVLVSLTLMTLVLGGVVAINRYFNDRVVTMQKREHVRLLAESGIAIASHPDLQPGDPALVQKIDSYNRIETRIENEQAKIQINRALGDGETWILERLFQQWKIPAQETAILIARMQDWMDIDTLPRPGGAEWQDYVQAKVDYRPASRPFRSIDEMRHVLGIELLDQYQPDWINYFTVYGNGRIDLMHATREIIAAVCEISESKAMDFIAIREQKDSAGLPKSFQHVQELRKLLGMTPEEFRKISSRITLESEYRKIHSVGISGTDQYVLNAILKRKEGRPIYIEWRESNP